MELPHGEANKQLIKDGYWDWSKDPEYREYRVEVTGTVEINVFSEIEVWATSKEHAQKQVLAMKTREFDWDDDGWNVHDIDGWDITDTQMITDD